MVTSANCASRQRRLGTVRGQLDLNQFALQV
jgi:hypothetical protein